MEQTRAGRKGREHTRKCYRPTGDWAMRVSQQDIVPEISAEQVDQADQSWDFLESHAIPSVMLCDLSIVHERDNKQVKEKIVQAK